MGITNDNNLDINVSLFKKSTIMKIMTITR